jgi:hypothetical protein
MVCFRYIIVNILHKGGGCDGDNKVVVTESASQGTNLLLPETTQAGRQAAPGTNKRMQQFTRKKHKPYAIQISPKTMQLLEKKL